MTREEKMAAEIMARAVGGTVEIIKAIRSAVREEDRPGSAPNK